MKISLTTCALTLSALLAAQAMAGDPTNADGAAQGPHGMMRADTNGDGKVSKEEAAAMHDKMQGEWFDKADANKDGFLTEDEMRQARFKEADANSDGQLSLDEVQVKMPRLAERFNTLDADKNGMLSKDELKRGGPGGHPRPQG